ncbi:hypothetical protein PCCS19_43750 [Paenibacillus sp. CCS19]|uniref:DUF4269 domain-containing protein n=1 Tax=Paenibacillus sp. CCS19 TaxID=3158387 RepID=UPI00256AE68D|nr:DUF4269 domain-containing protein [Paenibacillus cellulosilyticus]GMK41319.1 hypothetical protein PCCS19_43750 [Paenibacillus cellulosilyticus]
MNIDYLKAGSIEQDEVYHLLTKHKLLDTLQDYDPILVGTVPIGVHTSSSDLDIICCIRNFTAFEQLIQKRFSSESRRRVDDRGLQVYTGMDA